MGECADKLEAWPTAPKPGLDEEAQFSLQMAEPATREAMTEAVAVTVGGRSFKLEPAFPLAFATSGQGEFWILTLPDLRVKGAEGFAFEVARHLRVELKASSARPVLVDSLIGAVAAAPPAFVPEAMLGSFCESNDTGPEARGWAPVAMGVREAWTKTRGENVIIASIDTGLSSHDEVRGVADTTRPHINLVEGGGNADDRFSNNVLFANPGHGTLVASVAASRGDIDAYGATGGPNHVTGSAPRASILPIRAIRSVVDVRQSRIPAAIEHAIAREVDVIIMCLGSAFVIEPVEAALRKAAAAGIVTVCAAGNCYGPVVFPAKLAPQGLASAIAAVDYAYQPWEKTSKGSEVTVSAFGEAVWGARKRSASEPDDRIEPSQGTTLATALTAGVAALWVAHHGRATLRNRATHLGSTVQRLFNEALQASAYRPSGWPSGMGAGLVNAARLLAYNLDGPSVPADVPMAELSVTPLSRFLHSAVAQADPLAAIESTRLSEDYAAEALWRFYVGSAASRARAAGLSPPAGAEAGPDSGHAPTAGLAEQLVPLEHLSSLVW
jgi:serine protease